MDILSKPLDLVCVQENSSISKARDVLNRNGIRTAIVLEGDKLVGICTDGNLRRNPSAELHSKTRTSSSSEIVIVPYTP